MKRGHLWKVSLGISAEVEEVVTEVMEKVLGQPVCIYMDAEAQTTHAIVYLERASDWSDRKRAQLVAVLRQGRSDGLGVGLGQISVTRIRREDWAESWKRHFKPLEIGRQLLVKPSWSQRQPRSGQVVVTLDPGLSFGTGQHPTTRYCLEQIVAFRRPGSAQSFLDVGTGSGILSIAAAKLGYGPVAGLDMDPEAIRIAKSNAQRNGVSTRLRLRCEELAPYPRKDVRKYDLICANLTSDVLLKCNHAISSRLCANGRLVLAGILESQFPAIREAYRHYGFRLVISRTEQEWESGVFAVDHTMV